MLLIDIFDKAAENSPDATCLRQGNVAHTYGQVLQHSHALAAGLQSTGVTAGAKTAVLSPNAISAYFAVFSILRGGYVWVSLNYRAPIDDIVAQLNLADVELLFFSKQFAGDMPGILDRCPNLKCAVALDSEAGDYPSLESLAEPDAAPVLRPDARPSDTARISFTGGTSGSPKAAKIPYRAQTTFTETLVDVLGTSASDKYLLVSPLSHAAGSGSFAYFAVGGEVILASGTTPVEILDAMEEYEITGLFLPPTLIYMMLDELEENPRTFPKLRHLIYGAAPMNPGEIERAMRLFGSVLMQIYAQSEAPMAISHMLPQDHADALKSQETTQRLASAGRVCAPTEVQLVSQDGAVAKRGEAGEIWVKGPICMTGYHDNDDATAEAMSDGWVKTGDVGRFDEDGYLYIVDRIKDMIITGGFNVYPSQVENCLQEHPDVVECAVVGLPDPKWGEKVVAVVVPKDGNPGVIDEIRDFCRPRIGGVMTPKEFHVATELPKSHLGKIMRRTIKEELLKAESASL